MTDHGTTAFPAGAAATGVAGSVIDPFSETGPEVSRKTVAHLVATAP